MLVAESSRLDLSTGHSVARANEYDVEVHAENTCIIIENEILSEYIQAS
jgi:hypothetical protein